MSTVLNFYFPSIEKGGLEKNVFALVNSLAIKDYKINFYTYEDNTNKKEYKNKFYFHKNINVITSYFIPGIKNRYLKYFFCFIRLFVSLFFQKGMIISFQGNVLPIILAKLMLRKIVIRCNTAPSKYVNNTFKKLFFKFFYSLADLILVTSYDFKKEIKKYFNLPSEVHRQTLDIDEIKKKSREKVDFNFFRKFNGLKIINIGRLTYQKDQITLLKAFSKLLKFRKSRLLILGSGEDLKKLRDFISRKKINNHVEIISYAANPFKYISLCDVKVLTSKYEGSPNILLETGCLKKLMISSNCKVGPRETLQSGKGGILFKVGDFNKLFLILKELNINSIENKKKIVNTYNYIKKNYQKDIGPSFEKLIKKIK